MSNVPVYYLSLFKVHEKIIQIFGKSQRDFLWESGLEKRDHMVNWKDVCRPKLLGGLGIGHIKEINLVLIGKWHWRFSTELDNLWHSTILGKYGINSNG